MKVTYDGHDYEYSDDYGDGELFDATGELVATVREDISGEYYYIDILELDDDQQPPEIHVNVIQDTAEARATWAVQSYAAATS